VLPPPHLSPLIDRVVFYEKLNFYGLFCGLPICQKMHWWPGLHPGPCWWERCSPRPLSRLGRGTPVLMTLRCFDPRAPCGSLVPPPTDLELAMVLKMGMNRQFQPSDKDHQVLFVGHPKICPSNPKWEIVTILKKR